MNIRRAHSHGKPWLLPYMKGGDGLYTGIDSLNSAALEWLDRECNGTIHERTRKAPRELFREESKHLEKVQTEDVEVAIRAVSDKNAVIYGWSKYELPRSRVKQYDRVRISMLREQNKRYANVQMRKIVSLAKNVFCWASGSGDSVLPAGKDMLAQRDSGMPVGCRKGNSIRRG